MQGTGTSAPPDTDGDVSPDYYVQMINNVTEIYNKTGTIITAQFLNLLFLTPTAAADFLTFISLSHINDTVKLSC